MISKAEYLLFVFCCGMAADGVGDVYGTTAQWWFAVATAVLAFYVYRIYELFEPKETPKCQANE